MEMTEDWSGLGIPGSGGSWRLLRYAYIYSENVVFVLGCVVFVLGFVVSFYNTSSFTPSAKLVGAFVASAQKKVLSTRLRNILLRSSFRLALQHTRSVN